MALAAVAVDVVVVAVGDELVGVVLAVAGAGAGEDAAALGGALVVRSAVEEAGVTVENDCDDCEQKVSTLTEREARLAAVCVCVCYLPLSLTVLAVMAVVLPKTVPSGPQKALEAI